MHRGFSRNEYGTKISLHTCNDCGADFSLCPAQERDDTCGHPECSSYDESRDVEKLLENGAELKKVSVQ